MKIDEFQVMYRSEDTYWWYVGMRNIFLSLLDGHYKASRDLKVLDAGCGTGAMLGYLRRYGQVFGLDISSEAMRFCTLRGVENCRLIQSSLTELPFNDEAFDLITSFDVICCVDEDMLAFQELSRVLRPGGRLLLNLPAYGILHSEHDLAVHIKRRYTRPQVADKVERAGLTVERMAYANTLLFPIWAAVRIAKKRSAKSADDAKSDLKTLPPIINRWLTKVLFLEGKLLQKMDLPFGLSVICLARK
jgi:SAM-dependent methyltransferase